MKIPPPPRWLINFLCAACLMMIWFHIWGPPTWLIAP
jgi:hypothetical protein